MKYDRKEEEIKEKFISGQEINCGGPCETLATLATLEIMSLFISDFSNEL